MPSPSPRAPPPSTSSSTPSQAPLQPTYILRLHAHPVSVLHFPSGSSGSAGARWLLSGDTSGLVILWDLKTFRPRASWQAHEGGVLGIEEWGEDGEGVLTQGRDNLIRFWSFSPPSSSSCSTSKDKYPDPPSPTLSSFSTPSTAPPSTFNAAPAPRLVWEMPINALNFCRIGVLRLPPMAEREGKGKEKAQEEEDDTGEEREGGEEGLVAVVSLTKDDFVDVFHLPSQARIHRSIGAGAWAVGEKTGSVMALKLFSLPSSPSAVSVSPSSAAEAKTHLHLLAAYESGAVSLFRFSPTRNFEGGPGRVGEGERARPVSGKMVEEGEGWEVVWTEKGHRDAVMSLALSPDKRFAYSVAADHFLCKYRVFDLNAEEAALPRMLVETTTSPGKSGIAVRGGDGKLVATAGWDGEIRLHAAKTLEPLAALTLHRQSLQAVAFAAVPSPSSPSSTSSSASSSAERPLFPSLTEGDTPSSDSDSDDDQAAGLGGKAGTARARAWLAAGGQEGKISLWEVYPPAMGR
ncbi:hypothetical protein JCM8097_002986 [Rhodosporidiobolus ruineniae]